MKIISLNFRNLLSLWLSVLIFFNSNSQTELETEHIHLASCGVDADFLRSLSDEIPAKTPNLFPPTAKLQCGAFELYFADLLPGSPAVGFADPVEGLARRNTFCAVLTYIQSVYDFSAVPTNAPIRIRVNLSLDPVANPAPVGTRFLATAGANMTTTGLPHIIKGFVGEYANTGNDPASALQYHGVVNMNFDKTYNNIGNAIPIVWHNNYLLPMQTDCAYDLFSVLLHEMGHAMGFVSYANDNGTLDANSIFNFNQFSGLDFVLHRGQMGSPTGLQKLLLGSQSAPIFNSALTGAPIDQSNFWLNEHPAPFNHPVYSGQDYNYSPSEFLPPSSLSHIDDQPISYTTRSRVSPGFAEKYVMGPYGIKGSPRRTFSDPEINLFIELGYTLNPSYSNVAELTNTPPYSAKIANFSNFEDLDFAEITGADHVMQNNTGSSWTIDLQADATAIDPEGTPLTVATGTLVNLRGCGNGGNNHDQLSVSTDGRYITFTPRANFMGRAQFGFRLYDGIEMGSYHLYTVDVTHGSNVNYPPGSNLIINGDLEEGSEVRRAGIDEVINYSIVEFGMTEGFFMRGTHFGDAHPYNYRSSMSLPFSRGDVIRNSHVRCIDGVLTSWESGAPIQSFPYVGVNGNPNTTTGDRYRRIAGNFNYLTMGAPLQKCHKYILKFDYTNNQMVTASMPITFGFTDNATYPALPNITQSFSENLPVMSPGTWQHMEIPFTYCSDNPADILNLSGFSGFGLMMDNFEIIEDLVIPPLTVEITGSTTVCTGASTVLSASYDEALCDVSFLWSNGQTTPTITLTPTANTTIGLTVYDGCRMATVSETIYVTSPPVMQPMTGAVYCEGSPVNIPAFSSVPAGATFSWTNDNLVIGLPMMGTGNIPVFTANNPFIVPTSGTITVFPSIGSCTGNPVTFTITVNPQPVVTQISDLVVCPGAQIPMTTLTSTPNGASLAWSNSNTAIGLGASGTGNIPAFTAVNNTLSPITSTITVVPVLAHCAGNPMIFTITVNPGQIITATPANSTIVAGASVNLLASGGTSYTWAPAAGLSCTSCPNPVATPSVSTTYVVSSTNSYGCTTNAFAVVTIAGPPCTNCPYTLAPGGTLTSNPTSNRVYCVNNTVQVTGNITISNCELKMAANTQIVVTPGSTLNLLGCHLYSCGAMWQGIQVLPGGKVLTNDAILTIWPSVTTKSTLIEDAIIAIDVNPNSNVTADLLTINNTTFNRNGTGIRVSDYAQNVSNYPFNIAKSTFTCRNIPFAVNSNAWPQTPTVAGSNPSATPLTNQVINNATYSQTGTAAFLKAPFPANTKSKYGVQIINVGTTTGAATTSPAYTEFKLGNPAFANIFDNQQTCVEAISSNLQSINNIFQNTGVKGIGIAAKAAVGKNNRLQVVSVLATAGMNKFVDCGTAILSENYFEHNIRFCDVRTAQVNGNGSTTRRGFNIKTNRYRVCDVISNSMYNVSSAVSIQVTNGSYNVSGVNQSGHYAGKINVDFNTIRPNLSGASVTTQYVSDAITLENPGTTPTEFANNITPVISTNMNTIFANRGILYTNWIKQNVQSQNNNVTVLFNPFFFVGAPHYGINVNNSLEGSSNGNFIKSNTVNGFYTPTANSIPANDPNLTGIVTSISGRMLVTCNNTSNTVRGIGFSGGNQLSLFKNNKMQNHRYGFFLDQNGVIGQQGTVSDPSDNQWNGTWLAGNFKTATINGSTAQNSKMYVRSSAAYNPNGSGVSTTPIFSNNLYGVSAIPQTLFPLAIAPPIFDLSCIQIVPLPFFQKSLEIVAGDSIEYSDDIYELGEKMRYINKNLVYLTLKVDSLLTDSSTVLQDFYNSSLLTAREKIHKIQKNMSRGDLFDATLSNMLFNPENNIEGTYKRFHEIYIGYQQGICGTVDSTDLRGIAEKCPFNDGSVVYQARALYNLIFDTREAFPDLCPEEVALKSMMTNETLERSDEILLYPNPAKGEVFIVLDEPELLKIEITVMDANGKIVFANSVLDVRDGLTTFTLNVDNGIYFVNVINPITHKLSVEKLVIHK